MALFVTYGCPANQPETTRTGKSDSTPSDSQANREGPNSKVPVEKVKKFERVFTDEQNQAARDLAKELNIYVQMNDDGYVTVLDTAKERSWVEEYQLPELLTLDYLTSLTLEGPGISDEAATSIATLPQLTSLTMKNTLIGNTGIEKLKEITTLRILDLRFSPLVTDEAMKVLASMENLRAVRLNGVSQLTDAGLYSVLQLPSLVELDVRSCQNVSGKGIEKFVGKSTLRMLKIGDQSVSDSTLQTVARIEQLTGLAVQNSNITNDGLAALSALDLKDVTIEQCSAITDEGLGFLESYGQLRKLTLRDLRITGAIFDKLSNARKLTVLNVAQTNVDDDAVKSLLKMENLTELNLSETLVSDAAVEILAQLPNLKKLYVMQTKMTDAGVDKLKAALPDCNVQSN